MLREFFPEVCEEIRGVMDTIGADYGEFSAWLLCMGCCMYNLEKIFPLKYADARRLLLWTARALFMEETTICCLICATAATAKYTLRSAQINLTLRHRLL